MKIQNNIQFFLSLVSLVILLQIYQYLSELEHCPCFMDSNNGIYQSDLSFMKFYQFLEIISLVIFTFLFFMMNKKIHGGKKQIFLSFLMIITIFIMLFISGYMSVNVAKFYFNVKNECKCVNKWQKYFLYMEGIFNSVFFLRLLFSLLFLFLVFCTSFLLK